MEDTYKLKKETLESINRTLQSTLGMSYEEFSTLDVDEQEKIVREYHEKHPRSKKDSSLVMIGSGESALFVRMKKGEKYLVTSGDSSIVAEAGLTREEQDRRLNEYFDRQTKEQKPKGLKQLIKRIKR